MIRALEQGLEFPDPVKPNTIAKSLAIGNPADGFQVVKVVNETGGSGAMVSDDEILDAIQLLASTEGIFTEPAGGTTVAATRVLIQRGVIKSGRLGGHLRHRQRLQDRRSDGRARGSAGADRARARGLRKGHRAARPAPRSVTALSRLPEADGQARAARGRWNRRGGEAGRAAGGRRAGHGRGAGRFSRDLSGTASRSIAGRFGPDDLDGVWWVVAAAPPDVNRQVQAAAEARQLFVNAVDDPAHATAYLGGVVRRDDVTIAISTGGRAPALAGLLREALDAWLPQDIDRGWRRRIEARRQWKEARRADGTAAADAAGDVEPAVRVEEVMSVVVREASSLVGAGPGDPELWTVRGLRRVQEADLVLYDALIDAEALRRLTNAQCFCVGKRAGRASVRQETIYRLMIRAAREGQARRAAEGRRPLRVRPRRRGSAGAGRGPGSRARSCPV